MKSAYLLKSKLFIAGLLLLLSNDFWMKYQYGGILTGKISDFCGLFIFPIFLTAISDRTIKFNYLVTALIFIFWNSFLSQPLIDIGISKGIPFHRTIDFSDFIALISLPLSYAYVLSLMRHHFNARPLLTVPLCIISFFSFTATTLAPNFGANLNKTYTIDATKEEVLQELHKLNGQLAIISISEGDTVYNLSSLIVDGDSIISNAHFSIKEVHNGTKIHLMRVETYRSNPAFFAWNQKKKIRALILISRH